MLVPASRHFCERKEVRKKKKKKKVIESTFFRTEIRAERFLLQGSLKTCL